MSSSLVERRAVVPTTLAVCGVVLLLFASQARAAAGAQAVPVPPQSVVKYWLEPPPAGDAGIIARGKWLFRQKGCFVCHGEEGRGGVKNQNYVRDTIPALDRMAERLMLSDSATRNAMLDQMKRGSRLEALIDSPPVPRFNVILAQYRVVRDVIRTGSVALKKDRRGPTPLRMPTWGRELSDADIDAVIAYLLTLQP